MKPCRNSVEKSRVLLLENKIEWGEKPVVIVDLDGTLSDCSHRLHYVKSHPKNFKQFHIEACNDLPVDIIASWVRTISQDCSIVIISGRPSFTTGDLSVEWLRKYDIPFSWIFFCWEGDKRPGDVVKKEILNELVNSLPRGKDQILFAIEDRKRVVDMWRREGVRVIPVRCVDEDF